MDKPSVWLDILQLLITIQSDHAKDTWLGEVLPICSNSSTLTGVSS